MMRKKDDYKIRQRNDNCYEVEIKGERQSTLLKSTEEAKVFCNEMLKRLDKDLNDLENSEPLTPKQREEIKLKNNKNLILETIRKINE